MAALINHHIDRGDFEACRFSIYLKISHKSKTFTFEETLRSNGKLECCSKIRLIKQLTYWYHLSFGQNFLSLALGCVLIYLRVAFLN